MIYSSNSNKSWEDTHTTMQSAPEEQCEVQAIPDPQRGAQRPAAVLFKLALDRTMLRFVSFSMDLSLPLESRSFLPVESRNLFFRANVSTTGMRCISAKSGRNRVNLGLLI